MKKLRPIAVITGDIIRSTRMPPEIFDAVSPAIIDAVAVAQRCYPDKRISKISRFRGDSWQVLLDDVSIAARIMLLIHGRIRMLARKAASRMALGIGYARDVNFDDPGLSMGMPFEISGGILDAMRGRSLFDVGQAAHIDGGEKLPLLDIPMLRAGFGLSGFCANSWSSRQAEVFFYLLRPNSGSYSDVAALLEPRVADKVVGEHFRKGAGNEILAFIRAFESSF